jgi:hypothetical protein
MHESLPLQKAIIDGLVEEFKEFVRPPYKIVTYKDRPPQEDVYEIVIEHVLGQQMCGIVILPTVAHTYFLCATLHDSAEGGYTEDLADPTWLDRTIARIKACYDTHYEDLVVGYRRGAQLAQHPPERL